jgi:hypothetical protein
MLFVFVLLFKFFQAFDETGFVETFPLKLGDTELSLNRWSPNPFFNPNSRFRFLNLHQNENASVVATKAYLLGRNEGKQICTHYSNNQGVYFISLKVFLLMALQLVKCPFLSLERNIVLIRIGIQIDSYFNRDMQV